MAFNLNYGHLLAKLWYLQERHKKQDKSSDHYNMYNFTIFQKRNTDARM